MSLLTKKKFSFQSTGMDKDTFTVISFKGFEAISKPYQFEILLVSEKKTIDPLQVLENPVRFTIHRDQEKDVDFNGILMQFAEIKEFNDYLFYKAVLTPKLWWLSLTHHNQVFLDMNIPDIMQAALKDGNLAEGIDFEFRLQNNYFKHEYTCQYNESHLNFVSRWAEREGIYYFFEQTVNGEKVVFTDTKMSHIDLVLGKDLIYHPQSGLDTFHTREVIKNFLCEHNMLPQRVILKDYNHLKPSLTLEGIADVDAKGRGENYIYGEHFNPYGEDVDTDEEPFDIADEGNRLANIRAEELICRKSVFHGNSSVPFIMPGFTFDLKDHYRDFYNQKYLITDVTHEGHQTGYLISGLSAAVAPQDEQMFYANTFKAIYSDVQFRPERNGVRPRVSGTIHAKIDAASSGEYADLDKYGRYKVILPFDRSGRHNGKASAWVRMMQPYAGPNQGMHFPLHKGTEVLLTFIDGDPDRPLIAGAVPNPETTSPVTEDNLTKCIIQSSRSAVNMSVGSWQSDTRDLIDDNADDILALKNQFFEIDNTAGEEVITIHSDGDLSLESQNRYGEYHAKNASFSFSNEGVSRADLLKKFDPNEDTCSYEPTGMLNRHTGDEQAVFFDNVFANAHVHVSSMDTVNTQEGNIYDFGGYWNYNLGNSYTENHIVQQGSEAKLNFSWEHDLAVSGGPNQEIKCNDLSLADNITTPGLKSKGKSEDTDPSFSKSLSADKVWVEKVLGGASYNYINATKTLNVEVGTAEETHIYGRASYEYKYVEGKLVSKSISKGGHSEDWKYDRITGDMLSHDKKDWLGLGGIIFTSSFSMGIKSSVAISISSSNSANFDLGAVTSFSLSGSATAKININFAADFNLTTGLGIGLELDLRAGGAFTLKPSGGLKFDAIGFTARKQAALDAKIATVEAHKAEARIGQILAEITSNKARIKQNDIMIGDNRIDIRKCEGCIVL